MIVVSRKSRPTLPKKNEDPCTQTRDAPGPLFDRISWLFVAIRLGLSSIGVSKDP